MSDSINRRRFIRDTALGVAGLALAPRIARAQKRGRLKLEGPPQNIVILGGGLAGLAAGYELKQAGHTITILEARKQPGGRVRTLRNFSDGLYVEAGAQAFPQEHEFTLGYAVDFGLSLQPSLKFGLESVAHIRGSRFRIGAGGVAEVPFPLRASERQAGIFGLPSLYLGDFMNQVGNPRRANWPPEELRPLDEISLEQLLRDLGASDGAIDILAASQLGVLGFGLDSISALDGVVTEKIATTLVFYEIAGGNDLLPKAFKQRVKKAFKKKAIVQRIEQDETGVTVIYERKGVIERITADRVICTLPFPILKEIEVIPTFSEEKQRAIEEIKLTPITRTYMQFRTRVWEQDRLTGDGITDLSIQNTYSPTLIQGGRRGVLASYTGGQRALDLGDMSENERQQHVRREMGKLFGGLDSEYEMGMSQIWHKDKWAKGGFTYFEPGQITGLLPAAQHPEGRIHFAGEHTSLWHGWMNGALESGNRAAEEVNEAGSAEAIRVR
ncbi:MAG: FAD-dependent oxidoreductase [Blastocatellia bacterium]|nr:FAD-dependent oxidoreductase [Blastocatellia bacterium]